MGAQGTTTVDFGEGSSDVTVTVAETAITGTQLVEAWAMPASTVNNTVTNHFVENLRVVAHSIVPSTGFSITVLCTQGIAHGVYNIGYVFN
jgi:hypothetical protein